LAPEDISTGRQKALRYLLKIEIEKLESQESI
jgi:hypothetical protein